MLAKEIRRDPFRRRLIRDRLRAVLAKLGDLAMFIRAGPGAALAIEAILLIHLQQCFRAAQPAHSAYRKTRCLNDCRKAGCGIGAFSDPCAVNLERVLRPRGGILLFKVGPVRGWSQGTPAWEDAGLGGAVSWPFSWPGEEVDS